MAITTGEIASFDIKLGFNLYLSVAWSFVVQLEFFLLVSNFISVFFGTIVSCRCHKTLFPAIHQRSYPGFVYSCADSLPMGIWCQNDIVSMSMRCNHIASTLIRRHFYVMRLLSGLMG